MTKLEVLSDSPDAMDSKDSSNSDRRGEEDERQKGSGGCAGKYLLRPRSVRSLRRCGESEWNITEPRRQKSRPAPLSKYRRKTANTRERFRMRQINTAFEKLRKILPAWGGSAGGNSTEMTKITTLKYACAYIRSLQDILESSVTQHKLEGGSEDDGCPWVLSSMLDNSSLQDPGSDTRLPAPDSSPSLDDTRPEREDADLMELLCDSSDSGVFDESLDSLSYLSPVCEADEVALLLLGADTSYWHDPAHAQFASC